MRKTSNSESPFTPAPYARELTVPDTAKPIIDMHLHAFNQLPRTESGEPIPRRVRPGPGDPVPPLAQSDEDVLRLTLEAMDTYNIVKGVISDRLENVYKWKAASPKRFLAGVAFNHPSEVDVSTLRAEFEAGQLHIMGEIGTQYSGICPNDPVLEPYFALAEEFDVPALIHTGGLGGGTNFHIRPGHPELLQEVLFRHPNLRIYLENAGWPFLEEITALMYVHPNVYADLSTISWLIPRKTFHRYLQRLIDAGLGNRLMFGSDQMWFPEVIGLGVEAIESAGFLTEEQKRDILYANAARFLRLDQEEIDRHHNETVGPAPRQVSGQS
jgi:predicted TIM-barrel fold metal-dependent hydrolase